MVIGLDGASFNFIKPFCEKGLMPNLHSFWKKSCSGELLSSYPPITPTAWASFTTGKLPGKHRILNFGQFSFCDKALRYNTSADIQARTLWSILSDRQRKVAVVNVPMTYPPEPVNGILISDYQGVPNPSVEYTHPQSFKSDLLKHIPDYLNVFPEQGHIENDRVFGSFVRSYTRTVDHYYQTVQLADNKLDWDFLMVVFPHTDMGHHVWRYIDPEISGRTPDRSRRIAGIFQKLDEALGRLFALAQRRGATVVIMSDHGHGPIRTKIRVNNLLKDWGYLVTTNPLRRFSEDPYRKYQKLRDRNKRRRLTQHTTRNIDWSRTKAAVCEAPMWGFLYINVRGRQSQEIVEAGEEYERFRENLIERFLEVTDPKTGEELFSEVIKPEEVYGTSKTPWNCPDLLLVPQEGVVVYKRIRSSWTVKNEDPIRAEGTHLLKGLWMAAGDQLKTGTGLQANIHDLAPTILTMMGLPVPSDMDGKVITSMFKEVPKIQFCEVADRDKTQTEGSAYSIREEEEISRHLANLGYID